MQTITPNRNRRGLFASAREVDPNDSSIDWTPDGGWEIRSQCPKGGLWCCDGSPSGDPEKCDPAPVTGGRFKPVMMYQTTGCYSTLRENLPLPPTFVPASGTSRTPQNIQIAIDHGAMWLDVNAEGWIGMALESGPCNNPPLTQLPDITPLLGLPSIGGGISMLLRNRAALGIFDRPTLHIPAWFAAEMQAYDWLNDVADIVFGSGYGIDPPPASGEANIYITGPVEYSINPVRNIPADSLDEWRQNTNFHLIEGLFVYRYDPCGGFRVRVQDC